MSTKESTVQYIEDQLSGLKVTSRKMFGEYALYLDGKVIAFVCDDTLFVKITEAGREFAGKDYREAPAYPGSKPYMQVHENLIDDAEWLKELFSITGNMLPAQKPKKKATKKKSRR